MGKSNFKVVTVDERKHSLQYSEPKLRYYVAKLHYRWFFGGFYLLTTDWWYEKERAEEVVFLLNNPEEFERRIKGQLTQIANRL
jgi:hypothetical protein